MQIWRDFSPTTVVAGAMAVLVAFSSTLVVIFQAAQALGGTPEQLTSWIWAISMGCGLVTLVPSLLLKKPVMAGWSVPGAVVIATTATSGGFSMAEGVGAFILSAAAVILVGMTGWFERAMNRIPLALANALLAGILGRFALEGFGAASAAPLLLAAMLLAYFLARRCFARYAVIATLTVGVALAWAQGQMQWSALSAPELAVPVFTWPVFTLAAAINMAVPLFIVTMASQNLPGVAVIRAMGYHMPVSRLVSLTGVTTLLLAPFGCYSLTLASVTAAICMGPESHENPARRYTASVACGLFYLLIACFAGVLTGLLLAFPTALVLAIAGIALLSTIGGSLAQAMADERQRETALVVFLITLSGLTIAGIGSAFWGVIAGAVGLLVQNAGRQRGAPENQSK